MRDNQPEVLDRAKALLCCKDYIRYRLTGEVYQELTDMSGTSLMNVGTGQYDMDDIFCHIMFTLQQIMSSFLVPLPAPRCCRPMHTM